MLETEPHRALGAGNQAGISIVLRAYEYDMDYACRGPVQGFKVQFIIQEKLSRSG